MEFGGAEALLLRQLCLHMAFPTEREGQAGGGTLLPAYLSGESRLMLENFPELGFFRDIVFLFKMLMVHTPHRPLGLHAARVHRVAARLHGVAARVLRIAACFAWVCSLCYPWSQVPSSDALPEICAWMPLDAALAWKHKPEEGFVVWGFGRLLSPAAIQKQAEEGSEWWISRRVRRAFGFAEKPRAPPSSADPSALLRAELGESATRIETEDDVLHLKARYMLMHEHEDTWIHADT